ncbi:MAG TPA: type IV pilin, partial [Methanocorpusculum sp.]|nr:type IV pilin [Methanocorpusculum sp.]
NGVSPVIGTILLVALSIILVSLVSVSVMSAVGSFTPVENKVVGFTVQVNASNNSALITPVSGTDLPFLESYRVYTNNGHWDKPDAGNITVPMFNSSVTYVNIVGNFTDRITALVFSGKVVVEGGVVVVEPDEPPGGEYYEVGSEPYTNATEFVQSINEWQPGTIVYENDYDNTGRPIIKKDIIVANEPIMITAELLGPGGVFEIAGNPTGNIPVISRAPGYNGALLVVEAGKFQISYGEITFDGMSHGNEPIIIVEAGTTFYAADYFIVQNGKNEDGIGKEGGGMYIAGTVELHGSTSISSNSAKYGGGIFIDRGGSLTMSGGSITANSATVKGGGVYNKGTHTLYSGTIDQTNAAPNGSVYYAVAGSTNSQSIYKRFAAGQQITTPTVDQAVDLYLPYWG